MMNSVYKQYAIIATKWVPNNPVKAFLPFIYNYIKINEPKDIILENISSGIDKLYNLHLTYPLLRVILQYLRNTNEATLTDGIYWNFKIADKNSKIDIDNIFKTEISALINGFISFLGENITKEKAENLINSFFSRYDYEVLNGQLTELNYNELDDNDYFVAEYIKSLIDKGSSVLDFIFKIAQGSIIKTAIASENLNQTIFKNKFFYLDTKIIFRLLGYCGKYYESEYNDLILKLKTQGANILISEYVYNEALAILRGCERYIDSKDYQYEKASDILRYFKRVKLSKTDIQSKIITFEDLLKTKYGIYIDRDDVYSASNLKYNENYNEIKKNIVDKYNYRNDVHSYFENSLETDLNSICHAYLKRKNNDIVLIKDAPLFFVTTNGALISSVTEYNADYYGKKISPIISDTFLGILLFKADNELSEYSKLKLLAFCNESYKPTFDQRQNFIKCVEKLFEEKKITSDQTFLLKNYELIDEVLVGKLRQNVFVISDDCVYEALDEIQHNLVKEVSESFERKLNNNQIEFEQSLNDNNKNHIKEIEHEREAHQREIAATKDTYNKKIQSYEENNKILIDKLLNSDIKPYRIKVTILYYAISSLILLAAILVIILTITTNKELKWDKILYICASGIIALFNIICIIINIVSKKILNYFIDKKIKKSEQKIQRLAIKIYK